MASNSTPVRELLNELPLASIDHLGRPLLQHLNGTHELLARWGNPQHVCLAGLFHSIYGTNTFRIAVLSTDRRDWVRERIGTDAEALVYVYGMSDRKKLLSENRRAPYSWVAHHTGERAELPEEMLKNLVEIEAANFVEQVPCLANEPAAVFEDMRHRFEAARSLMSLAARSALESVFDAPGF